MKMTSLEELHKSMLSIRADIQQFQIDHSGVSFDCLFSTRSRPYFTLTMTSRGKDPKFFRFEVRPGYWIKEFFEDKYGDLCKLFRTSVSSTNPLIPKEFLEQINQKIPVKASVRNVPPPHVVMELMQDITEHRDRPYFDTWIYWSAESGRGPTTENLHKTLQLLGRDAHSYSVDMKASSKWSAVDLGNDWEQSISKNREVPTE